MTISSILYIHKTIILQLASNQHPKQKKKKKKITHGVSTISRVQWHRTEQLHPAQRLHNCILLRQYFAQNKQQWAYEKMQGNIKNRKKFATRETLYPSVNGLNHDVCSIYWPLGAAIKFHLTESWYPLLRKHSSIINKYDSIWTYISLPAKSCTSTAARFRRSDGFRKLLYTLLHRRHLFIIISQLQFFDGGGGRH